MTTATTAARPTPAATPTALPTLAQTIGAQPTDENEHSRGSVYACPACRQPPRKDA